MEEGEEPVTDPMERLTDRPKNSMPTAWEMVAELFRALRGRDLTARPQSGEALWLEMLEDVSSLRAILAELDAERERADVADRALDDYVAATPARHACGQTRKGRIRQAACGAGAASDEARGRAMSEQTPGPWLLDVGDDGSQMILAPDAGDMVAMIPQEFLNRANACLIAAAPDLLNFVEMVSVDEWIGRPPDFRKIARALIARVKGLEG